MSELDAHAQSSTSPSGPETREQSPGDQNSEELDELTRGASRVLNASVFIASLTAGEQPRPRGATPISQMPTPERQALFYVLCLGVVDGEPLIVEDNEQIEKPREASALRAAGVRSCLCFPLRANSWQVIGLLCVVSDHPRIWRKAELSLVGDLAQLAAIELRQEVGMGIYAGNQLHLRTRRAVMLGLIGKSATRDGITAMLAGLCRNLRWDTGSAWFAGEDRESRLECVAHWGRDRLASERLASFHESLCDNPDGILGQIRSRQEPIWTSYLPRLTGERRATLAGEAGFEAGLWFPVINEGSALGVIELLTTQSEPQHDQLPLFALALGRQIGDLMELTAVGAQDDRLNS